MWLRKAHGHACSADRSRPNGAPLSRPLAPFPLSRLLAILLLFVCGILPAATASAAAAADSPAGPRVTQVHVWLEILEGGARLPSGKKVPRHGGHVVGIVEYQLSSPAKSGESLRLLDFAAFIGKDPSKLDAYTAGTYLDGKFEAGATTVLSHEGASAMRREGPREDLVFTLAPGARRLRLRYEVSVPRRYWPFGCSSGRCSLSGALAPLPSEQAQGGRYLADTDRVVALAHWTVERAQVLPRKRHKKHSQKPVTVPTVDGSAAPRPGPVELVVVGGKGELTAYPTIVWGKPWHRSSILRFGVEIEILHPLKRPSAQVPTETLIQLRADAPGRVLAAGQDLVELLAQQEPTLPPGSKLVAIIGPLRSEIAQAHPGTIFVSDQAFELFPARRFAKFHLEAIARALADCMTELLVRGRHDPSTDLWLAGTLAFGVLEKWRTLRAHRDEFASDILRNLAFIPAVDRFLYTQQVAFANSYFRGVEDVPVLRNHPLWFAHELPTGRRIYEKLRDTLGAQGTRVFVQAQLRRPDSAPLDNAQAVYGNTLGWFFEQWLGPYPKVDYLVGQVTSKKIASGYRSTITIEKRSSVALIESVQVLATEQGGEQHYLVWNGQATAEARNLAGEALHGAHVFTLETERALKVVRIDPRQRLVQTALGRENVDPRFNDRSRPSFRFIYTGIGFTFAASEFASATTPVARINAISGFAAFEGSLRRDMRRTGSVLVSHDRESVVALGAAVNFWFGHKLTAQRRRSRVRLYTSGAALSDASLDERGGARITQRLSLIDETRVFRLWPDRGRRVSVTAFANQVLRVGSGPSDDRFSTGAEAEWTQLIPLVRNHVLATQVRAEAVFPIASEAEFRSLVRVGGIGGLSGYVADEVFGRGLAVAQIEYRHLFLRNLRINALHSGYVRSLGGIAFAGVASTSPCSGFQGWFASDSWYGQVGYAAVAHASVLGVTPQVFRLEASVPLVRRLGVSCLGERLPDLLAERQGLADATQLLPRFNINLLFQQAF